MSKKGFTLVELLAVIIIVSLLAIIAGTSITKILKDSKEDLYNNQMELIKSATEGWAADNLSKLPSAGECKYLTLGDLKEYGIVDKSIKNPKTNEELSDDLIIKITGILSKYDTTLYDYQVGAESADGCIYAYPPKLDPQGTYLMVNPSVTSADTTFLGQEKINRSQVELITVTYINQVPSNAIYSWDVSAAKDGSVMAWYTDADNNGLYELYIGGEGGVRANPDSSRLFEYFSNAITIDVTYLNTSNVTTMYGMFSGCSSLTSLDVSNFNTSQVTNMQYMFSGCSSLTKLDLSNFNTSKVTIMYGIFQNCNSLTEIDMRKSIFTNVTDYTNMMYNLINLTGIIVKDADSKTFIEARLADSHRTGVTVTVAS